MSQLNDAIVAVVGPAINDGLLAHYKTNGAISDDLHSAEYEFLVAGGATPAHISDMWLEALVNAGFTGTISDMLLEFWEAGGTFGPPPTPDWTTDPPNVPDGNEGVAYNYNLAADLNTVAQVTITVETGTLPAGLSISGTRIIGTPTTIETQSGISLRATNPSGFDVSLTFDIEIKIGAVQWSSTPTPPSGEVGVVYNYNLTPHLNTVDNVTISVQSGSLPPGLSISGVAIVGTPTADGSFTNIVLRAQNSFGQDDSAAFSITVDPAAATLDIRLDNPVQGGKEVLDTGQEFFSGGGAQAPLFVGIPHPMAMLPSGRQTSTTVYQPPTPNSQAGWPYDPRTFTPAAPANWPSAESVGDYYIDPTHPSSTDTANPYGYPDQPRNTFPTDTPTLDPGSYVEFGGGTITGSEDWLWTCNGTAAQPVYIKQSGGQINGDGGGWEFNGTHIICDGLTMRGTRPRTFFYDGPSYVTLRNASFNNGNADFGGRCIAFEGTSNANRAQFFMLYNCTGLDIGTIPKASSKDMAFFQPRYYADYMWVIGCDAQRINSDFVVTGDAYNNHPAPADPEANIHYLWIGGNFSALNGENAVDVKSGYHVIVSENNFEDMDVNQGVSAANTTNIIASNNRESDHSGPVWILNNRIKNDTEGDLVRDSGTYNDCDIFVIGNVMYSGTRGVNIDWGGSGGSLTRMRNLVVVNNTIDEVDYGLQAVRMGNASLHTTEFDGNIVTNTTDGIWFDEIENGSAEDNLFWNSAGPVSFQGPFPPGWSTGDQIIDQDPLYTNAAARDYTLQAGSPAIDQLVANAAYQRFEDEYGMDIRQDRDGTVRPQGPSWDIGAYERAA